MSGVSFFTAVDFGIRPRTAGETIAEAVDSYFYLGGEKAVVLPQGKEPTRAVLLDAPLNFRKTVLKVISYFTLILPLIMLLAKAVCHRIYPIQIIDGQDALKEGLDQTVVKHASDWLMNRGNSQLRSAILDGPTGSSGARPALTWLSRAEDGDWMFRLNASQNFVFTLKRVRESEARIHDRFAKMILAKKICMAFDLNLLVIPRATIIRLDLGDGIQRTIIVQQEDNQEFERNATRQEELYRLTDGLENSARQLVRFIAKTGFSNVNWQTILASSTRLPQASNSGRRVALVDIGGTNEPPRVGLFGDGEAHRGLFRCLGSEAQIGAAEDEACRLGLIRKGEASFARDDLTRREKIAGFHQHAVDALEDPIGITRDRAYGIVGKDLGLEDLQTRLDYKECSITKLQAAEDVIEYMNLSR